MALTKTTDADGRVTGYAADHVVLVGPIRGTVTTKAGRVVDVTEPVVEAESPDEAAEIAHLVAVRYESEGHPTDATFKYTRPKGVK